MKYLFVAFLITVSILSAQSTGKITGRVVDKISQQPIPGVNILVLETQFGAATDLNGEFEITNVPVGNYQVKASAIGYISIVKSDVIVNSVRPVQLTYELNETVLELEDITVASDFFETEPTEVSSIKKFSYEEIRRSPGGFEDVVRALSVLPGVDETSFSTGGFSAIYGDKLSSVLKIDLREGRDDRIGGKATISASQFGLNLEGPVNNQSNFIFSVRRSYLDFIFNAAGFNFVPEYYDLLGKYDYKIDNSNKISYLFIGALDRVKFNNNDEEDIYDNARILGSNQNQYVTGISYNHLFSNGILKLSASRSYIKFDSFQNDTLLTPIFKNNSIEAEHELKGEVIYKMSPKSELNFGASAKFINFESDILFPKNFVTTFGDTLLQNNLKTDENFTKYATHFQYSNVFFNHLRFNLGVRADYFDAIDEPFYVSPRFSTAYNFNELTSVNFSTGIYHQFPSYIWLAAGNTNLKAIKVYQYILGFKHRLSEDVQIKLEGFYKDYRDYPTSTLRPYLVLANTGAGYGGSEENFESFGFEPLVSEGKGRARGVELSLQKRAGSTGLYGLISATYAQSDFTALDGIERPSAFEQNWIFNLSGGYIFNNEWEVSFKFRYASGRPSTPYNPDGTQSLSNYLTDSLPPIHALDLRVDKRWHLGSVNLITYIDVQNVYNRSNIQSLRWDYKEMKVDDESSIGILPSIGISLEF
jgi:outer membrane receptor protein involved in Fe transport